MNEPALTTIMLAEDEADIRAIAKIALEKIGQFTVTYCSSGIELLSQVNSVKPDLILLDVMMPEMDGVTTFTQLRKMPSCETIPVIFMTAKIQPHEIKSYLE